MKKLILLVTVLVLTLIMSGCNEESIERYVIYNDDNNTFVSCIVEDTLEDCYTVEIYTKEQVDQIVDQAIMEAQLDLGFPIEPTEEQWENLIKDSVGKEDFEEAIFDVINQAVTDEELVELIDEVLRENGFYEEYDDVVYDYMEDFFEAMLLQIFEEALAESEGTE